MNKFRKLKLFIQENGINTNAVIILFARTFMYLKLNSVTKIYFFFVAKKSFNINLLRLYFQFYFHIVLDLNMAREVCQHMVTKPEELSKGDKFYIVLIAGSLGDSVLLNSVLKLIQKDSSLYHYAVALLGCLEGDKDYLSSFIECYKIGLQEYGESLPEWVEHSANFLLDFHINTDLTERDLAKYSDNLILNKPKDEFFILISSDPGYFDIYAERIIELLRKEGNYQKIYFLIAVNEDVSENISKKIENIKCKYNGVNIVKEFVSKGNLGLQSSLIRYTLLQKYLFIEKCTALVLDIDLYVDMNFNSLYKEFILSKADVSFWDMSSSMFVPWTKYVAAIAFIPYSDKGIRFLSVFRQYIDEVFEKSNPMWTLDQVAIYYTFKSWGDTYTDPLKNYNLGDHQKRMSIKLAALDDNYITKRKQEIKMKYINRRTDDL